MNKITQLTLQLDCDPSQAHPLLPRCSRLFHERLRAELDALLADAARAHPDRHWCTLTVNLGELPLAGFEEVFLQRLRPRLLAQLRQGAEQRWEGDDEARWEEDDEVLALSTLPNESDSDAPEANIAVLLLHYLESGKIAPLLRCWLVKSNGRDWLPLPDEQARWQSQLAAQCLTPHGLTRLLEVLSPPQLAGLCQLFWPAANVWPPLDKPAYAAALALAAAGQMPPGLTLPLPPPLPAALLPLGPMPKSTAIDWAAALVRLARQDIGPASEAWLAWFGVYPTWAQALAPQLSVDLQPHLSAATPPAITNLPPSLFAATPPAIISSPTTFPISNAGLVLLWPFLPRILRQWEQLQGDQFLDQAAQCQAVCWIDSWLWQDEGGLEWRCGLTKWLCGLPPDQPLPQRFSPDLNQWPPLQACLEALLGMIPGLQRCSPQDVRIWYLQRPGELAWCAAKGGYWQLTVEPDACDILLDNPPWPLTEVALPWHSTPLRVDWLR